MIYAIVTVLVLIVDQAVKFWTTKNILLDAVGDECVKLIPGVVHLTNVHNYGAAFSILENARWLLVLVSLAFVIAIVVLISMEIIHTPFAKWTTVLVLAGALGNAIDRILYGYVVDMLELEFMNFAVFNMADIFITTCGILFCIHILLYKEPDAVRLANESPAARRRREEWEANAQPARRPADSDLPRRRVQRAEEGFDAMPQRRRREEPAEEPIPMPQLRRTRPDSVFDDEPPRQTVRAARPQPQAQDRPAPRRAETDGETYSLEDILSEFGKL